MARSGAHTSKGQGGAKRSRRNKEVHQQPAAKRRKDRKREREAQEQDAEEQEAPEFGLTDEGIDPAPGAQEAGDDNAYDIKLLARRLRHYTGC